MNACAHIVDEQRDAVLHITLAHPEQRNALSLAMVEHLLALFTRVQADPGVRAVVLRGTGGHFCAGADLRDLAAARQHGHGAIVASNRAFGHLLQQARQLRPVLICVLEGVVLGGGFGLACVSDINLAAAGVRFALPETGLGVLPAQIAPFLVERLGLPVARRLALTGAPLDAGEALRLGLVDSVDEGNTAVQARLHATLTQVLRCAPQANARTKALLLASLGEPLPTLLEAAAEQFADAVLGSEGQEGTRAFLQKRPPAWAAPDQGSLPCPPSAKS